MVWLRTSNLQFLGQTFPTTLASKIYIHIKHECKIERYIFACYNKYKDVWVVFDHILSDQCVWSFNDCWGMCVILEMWQIHVRKNWGCGAWVLSQVLKECRLETTQYLTRDQQLIEWSGMLELKIKPDRRFVQNLDQQREKKGKGGYAAVMFRRGEYNLDTIA